MLIFNKLRTQQALGRLEISNGSGGGSCWGGQQQPKAVLEGTGRRVTEASRESAFFELPWDKIRRGDKKGSWERAWEIGPNGQARAVGLWGK